MRQDNIQTVDFWDELERNITAEVDAALSEGESSRSALVPHLRDLEAMARGACDRRQTIQIIASGRSLLGDRTTVGPSAGPFAHADRRLRSPPTMEGAGVYLRWVMQDGDQVVTCRVLADTLRELFDDPDADAIDLFLGNRSEVEQAAQERYAAMGAPDGVVELEHIDFL